MEDFRRSIDRVGKESSLSLSKRKHDRMLVEGLLYKRGKFNREWKLRRFRLYDNGMVRLSRGTKRNGGIISTFK